MRTTDLPRLVIAASAAIMVSASICRAQPAATAPATQPDRPGKAPELTPPPLNIPPGALAGGLSAAQSDAVEKRVKYWAWRMQDASWPSVVQRAAQGLVDDRNWSGQRAWRNAYVPLAVQHVRPLVSTGDPIVRINAARVLAAMDDPRVFSTLEQMGASSYPEVRYLAWRGMEAIFMPLLAFERDQAYKLLDDMAAKIAKEPDRQVVGAMVQVLLFPATRPTVVPSPVFATAQRKAVAAMQQACPLYLKGILAGKLHYVEETNKLANALGSCTAGARAEPPVWQAQMQMLADITLACARLRDAALAAGSQARSTALRGLALEGEAALNAAAGTKHRHMEVAMSSPAPGAALIMAVRQNWIAEELKRHGVVDNWDKLPLQWQPPAVVPRAPVGAGAPVGGP